MRSLAGTAIVVESLIGGEIVQLWWCSESNHSAYVVQTTPGNLAGKRASLLGLPQAGINQSLVWIKELSCPEILLEALPRFLVPGGAFRAI